MSGLAQSVPIELADIRRAVAGDHAAFTRIVQAHHGEMTRLAYVIAGDESLAQDAAQSAWVVAWSKLGSMREPSRLRAWLLSIAANEARQIARRRRRHPVREIDADVPGNPRSDPATSIDRLDLVRALGALAPDDRAVLALRYVAGFDASAIGAATGRSATATRSKLSRLIARLREDLVT